MVEVSALWQTKIARPESIGIEEGLYLVAKSLVSVSSEYESTTIQHCLSKQDRLRIPSYLPNLVAICQDLGCDGKPTGSWLPTNRMVGNNPGFEPLKELVHQDAFARPEHDERIVISSRPGSLR